MKEYKMIATTKEIKRKLDKLKVHPRETYNQVLDRLLKHDKK